MPAPINRAGTTAPSAPQPDPTAEALRMLKSAFPLNPMSILNGNIVSGSTMIASATEIAAKNMHAMVTLGAARLKAAEKEAEAAAKQG